LPLYYGLSSEDIAIVTQSIMSFYRFKRN